MAVSCKVVKSLSEECSLKNRALISNQLADINSKHLLVTVDGRTGEEFYLTYKVETIAPHELGLHLLQVSKECVSVCVQLYLC